MENGILLMKANRKYRQIQSKTKRCGSKTGNSSEIEAGAALC